MIEVNSLRTERIIRAAEATGSKLVTSNAALEKCLQICVHWYGEALLYTSRNSRKRECEVLHRLYTSTNNLLVQLGNAPLSFYEPFIPKVKALRKQLSDLASGIETTLNLQSDSVPLSGDQSDFIDHLGYQDHFNARSGFEWLVGVYLIETYELNFKVNTRIVRKQYIAFVVAVLNELKIKNKKSSYSIESVRRAVRDDRRRRKVNEIDDLQFAMNRQAHLAAACGIRWK